MRKERVAFNRRPEFVEAKILDALEDSSEFDLDSCIEYEDDSFEIEFCAVAARHMSPCSYKVSGGGKEKTTLTLECIAEGVFPTPEVSNAMFSKAWSWLKESIKRPADVKMEFPKVGRGLPWVLKEDAVVVGRERYEYSRMSFVRFHQPGIFGDGYIDFHYDGEDSGRRLWYLGDKEWMGKAETAWRFILNRSLGSIAEEKARENQRPAKKETRKRCNVCGVIFCYTLEDVEKNERQREANSRAAVGALASVVVGSGSHLAANQMNIKELRDFSRCPNCGSADLRELTDGETAEPPAQEKPQMSAADEIMKFKQLLDMGIITQTEFDAKKAQLLDL